MTSCSYLEQCMALRCLIEHGPPQIDESSVIPKDSQLKFVIVPRHVLLSDLLTFILDYLDIAKPNNMDDCSAFVILPNWKPICLEDICDRQNNTTAISVLGQLSNLVVIKVHMPSQEASVLPSNVMRSLLKSLIPQCQWTDSVSLTWLKHAGCPLSETTVEGFLERPDDYEFEYEARREFSEWHSRMCLQYLEQISKASVYNLPMPPPNSLFPVATNSVDSGSDDKSADVTTESNKVTRTTRARTSFDPDVELPLLQKWFRENSHPTRDQMEEFKNTLNSLSSRRNKRQLDVANINYWFKNMRAYNKRKNLLGQSSSTSTISQSQPISVAIKEYELKPSLLFNSGGADADSVNDEHQIDGTVEEESMCSESDNSKLVVAADQEYTDDGESHDADQTNNQYSDADDEPENLSYKSTGQATFPSLLGSTPPYFAPTLLQQWSNASETLKASLGNNNLSKRRRSRVFIDPTTEIPQLEHWFSQESHPDSKRFQEYAECLNNKPFRLKQPKLEGKNIQLWFKNHRAKVKRERQDMTSVVGFQSSPLNRVQIPRNPSAALSSSSSQDNMDQGLVLPIQSPSDCQQDLP